MRQLKKISIKSAYCSFEDTVNIEDFYSKSQKVTRRCIETLIFTILVP